MNAEELKYWAESMLNSLNLEAERALANAKSRDDMDKVSEAIRRAYNHVMEVAD